MTVNRERLVDTFCALVRIDNPSGQETAMANHLIERCQALGFACDQDAAGNVYAHRDGVGTPIMFTAHMDSVAPAVGKEPVVRDGVVYSAGDTVLGADDLAAVAAVLEGVEAAISTGQTMRPVELLWTVQEEVGLNGARAAEIERLRSRLCLAFDLNGPVGNICIGSPAHDSFTAKIHGAAAHAGVAPETGISAIQVAAQAIAAMPLGRIDEETTANIGSIEGGKANNIVPDLVVIKGEARSRNVDKLDRQWLAMRQALESAATQFGARVEFDYHRHYGPSVLTPDMPVVQLAQQAVRAIGLEPELVVTGGGSDVSIITEKGIEAVNLSMGYEKIHSVDEHIAVSELENAARIVEYVVLASA